MGRLFLWLPVALGSGVALYFALPAEPTLAEAGLSFALGLVLILAGLRQGAGIQAAALLMAGWMAIGFAASALRTQCVYTPVLSQPLSTQLEGIVQDIQPLTKGGQRILLRPTNLDKLAHPSWPRRVRIKLKPVHTGKTLEPGDKIGLRGRLMPLPPPVLPGGFDFSRVLFFDGIGATGFAYSKPVVLVQDAATSPTIIINRLRGRIAKRIFDGIADRDSAAIAVALLTGYRAAIPPEQTAALRGAGLAHLLAISGLHLGLVSGTVYFLLRLVFALSPRLSLVYPVRKWAAATALITAIGYFLLSGMSVPTLRAMVMTGIVLLAVMMDRQAISMRLVAIAAFVVLILTPESLVGAGFHMSFAAVLGLVAVYEALRDRRGWLWRNMVGRDLRGYALGLVTTSVVAGGATALLAAFHFNRYAQFGLIGNLVAVPLTGFVVMPAGLLSLLAMPFGLEGFPLSVMAFGIEAVLSISYGVAGLKGAEAIVPSGPASALWLIGCGGLILLLLRGPVRLAGILPILIGLGFWNSAPKADILIDRDLKLVAVRGKGDILHFSSRKAAQFTRETWQRSDGVEPINAPTVPCDKYGCIFKDAYGNYISFARTMIAAIEDCPSSNVLIVQDYVAPQFCKTAITIDLATVRAKGAIALYWQADTRRYLTKQTTPKEKARRPWHPSKHPSLPSQERQQAARR